VESVRDLFMSFIVAGPYDYYHLILTAILLFVRLQRVFSSRSDLYLCTLCPQRSNFAGMGIGYVFHFHEIRHPLLPSWLSLIATNIVIFGQIIECWFLLSRKQDTARIRRRVRDILPFVFGSFGVLQLSLGRTSPALDPLWSNV